MVACLDGLTGWPRFDPHGMDQNDGDQVRNRARGKFRS